MSIESANAGQPSAEPPEDFEISVGNLSSIPSLIYHIDSRVRALAQLYRAGYRPRVRWNLTNVRPKQQSLAALSAFTAISSKIAKALPYAPDLLHSANRDVVQFWHDVGFLEIIQSQCIFNIIPQIESYTYRVVPGRMRLVAKNYNDFAVSTEEGEIGRWKDKIRDTFSKELKYTCDSVFRDSELEKFYSRQLLQSLALNGAELLLNAIVHGRGERSAIQGLHTKLIKFILTQASN